MANFIETNVNTSLVSRKQEFERVVKQLQSQLSLRPIYTNWIKFQVGNFSLDTSDPSQQLFVSLNYTKNGSGQANSFTLMVAYEPRMSDSSGRWNLDPNIIDKQLTIYSGSQKDKLKCWLQYGYGHGANKLVSPLTEGLVLDYRPELRDGLLFYTITGYSGLVVAVEDNITTKEMNDIRPTTAVKKIIEENIGADSENTNLGYVVEFGPNTQETDKLVDKIPSISNKNIFQCIEQILSMAVPEDYKEDKTKSIKGEDISLKRPYYTYEISETKEKKVITIFKIDPANPTDSMKTALVFDWMDKDNSIVRSWQPDIKGSVLLAQNYQIEKGVANWGIDDAGNVVETNLLSPPVSMNTNAESSVPGETGESGEGEPNSESASTDENSEKNKWARAIQYSYKASLVLVGIPCDIPIGMYIKVVPLIYGKPHHSAGLYMVTKSTDQIDSGGFITTLDLIKVTTESEYLNWKKGGV